MIGARRRLRVGFDGRALAAAAGGIRRYTRQLFGALAARADVELMALGTPVEIDLPPGITHHPPSIPTTNNMVWTQVGLPMTARGLDLDIYHGPAYIAPLWGAQRVVLTLHDVSYARHPEWYPYRRDPVRRAVYRACARRATWIITDSEFSRREIHAAYGLEPSRIAVVSLGVGAAFRPAVDEPASADPYLLHVGDLHARRNLETALRTVLEVRRCVRELSALRLVLVGVDRGVATTLSAMATRAHASECLEFRGPVADAELARLYRQALALIYPSRYEGFGLPLAEAMACGTPVIASNAGSIPEVVAEAGQLLDPDDIDGFIEAVKSVGLDAETRHRMRTASLNRSTRFVWTRTAEQTLQVYRSALSV